MKSPVYNVKAVPLEKIKANSYNPNNVASTEMKLLELSIWEDGYTMPVVCYYIQEEDVYEIVDGFHRYTVLKTSKRIFDREKGLLPVVVIDKDISNRMASTIRHNRAKSVVEELENIDTKNNKVIIWYRYNTDLELLQQEIKQSYVVFNGNLSEKEKEESITTFKTGTSNILIANILSDSTGLNLQEANYMIYYNNTFDYAKRVQSEDRIHRLGQNKNCHIIDIVGNCGIDDKIMESISKKESLSKSIRKRINSIKDNKEEIEKFKAEILKEF